MECESPWLTYLTFAFALVQITVGKSCEPVTCSFTNTTKILSNIKLLSIVDFAPRVIAKYENDLQAALVENVMAGGDSAGRGLLVGLVLGAHLGIEAIPPEWLNDMKAYPQIVDMLAKIDKSCGF